MKSEILRMLKEADGYTSGQTLSDRLGVSRTAVWKTIDQLKNDGYRIEAQRKKGYLLKGSPQALSRAEIESRMTTKRLGRQVIYYEDTDSTNLRARQLGEEGAAEGTLVVTDRQDFGKGRRGRSWDSPAGVNIYMSLLLYPQLEPSRAPMLTLVTAVAAAEEISRQTGAQALIKWPNDIVVNGRKTVGILTEMSAEIDFINYVVVGIGMNANMESVPEDLKAKATSLYLETGREVDRAALITGIIGRFEQYYEEFLPAGDLSFLQERYNALLVNKGRQVKILAPNEEYTGTGLGIDRQGDLLVERPGGKIEKVFAGEVSVRGVNGYV